MHPLNGHPLTDPHLRRLVDDTAHALGGVAQLADSLTDVQLAWSPAPGSWSVAQCLDHVAIVTGHFADQLGPVVGHARRHPTPPRPYRPRWWARRILARAVPDSAARYVTAASWRPAERPLPGAPARATAALQRIAALAIAADGVDINHVMVAAPASRLLRLSVGDALTAAVGHARRHVSQARRVRDHPAFPSD